MSVSDFPYPGNDRARPRRLPTPHENVSLWWCPLDATDSVLSALESWLSAAERTRALRFGTESLRQRYTLGRGGLRWVLARRLGIEPGRVPIVRGQRGRPQLADDLPIDFNVSHTRGFALVGLVASAGVRIGVDVEHGDRVLNHQALARKFLTAREQASIEALDTESHRRAFLRYWTCKEAMSKATGDALSAPLSHLEVEIHPALRLAAGPPPYVPANWTLAQTDTPEGFIGTVALWRASQSERATPL